MSEGGVVVSNKLKVKSQKHPVIRSPKDRDEKRNHLSQKKRRLLRRRLGQ